MPGEIPIQGTRPAMGPENRKDCGQIRLNNNRKAQPESKKYDTKSDIHKLTCLYTNADQLTNKKNRIGKQNN